MTNKKIDTFIFKTSWTEAYHLRHSCLRNNVTLRDALREAVIDYLIKTKEIESRESLTIEEQMDK